MNTLLYSIRSYKISNLEFAFDSNARCFDQSVWGKVEASANKRASLSVNKVFIAAKETSDKSEKQLRAS